jgi:hypothetical protein
MIPSSLIKSISLIEKIVTIRNKELVRVNAPVFLSWSLPFNHTGDRSGFTQYFALWVGKRGGKTLKLLYFGTCTQINNYLAETSQSDWELLFKSAFHQLLAEIKTS